MADKLFSSFGQDILDSLFWTATEPKDRKREHIGVLPHLVIAIIYVGILTLLMRSLFSRFCKCKWCFWCTYNLLRLFCKTQSLISRTDLVSLETFSKHHLYYWILLYNSNVIYVLDYFYDYTQSVLQSLTKHKSSTLCWSYSKPQSC